MLDPNKAPEGYVTVIRPRQGRYNCEMCDLGKYDLRMASYGCLRKDVTECSSKFREDKTDVYFIKKDQK